MSDLRPIEPIHTEGLTPRLPTTGEPIFERVDPRTLFVDPAYQRGLSQRSIRQIRRIVEAFDWSRFKPPVCALSEEDGLTRLRVIDGQHTAIAAASIPGLETIPIMIVEAPDTRSQAAAFIGQNTDRLAVTSTQMHAAALAAQDPEAMEVAGVCSLAGVTVLRHPPSGGAFKPRETIAITVISALIRREGAGHAGMVLRILAEADLTPIRADHVKALDHMLSEPQFGSVDIDALPASIAAHGTALREAAAFAATHGITQWKALASVWFQKAKKRRPTMKDVQSPRAKSTVAL